MCHFRQNELFSIHAVALGLCFFLAPIQASAVEAQVVVKSRLIGFAKQLAPFADGPGHVASGFEGAASRSSYFGMTMQAS
jgi:hypothetical protein